jgi:hypothetical protein
MNNTTGGPAFPCEWDYINSNREAANGMTLRDYLAAKAMQGFVSDPDWRQDMLPDETAKAAYYQADAMLKVREA